MVNIITPTKEKYDCPKSLNAKVYVFPSLQADMRACGGHRNRRGNLADICISCEKYVVNAQKRDWESVDGPV